MLPERTMAAVMFAVVIVLLLLLVVAVVVVLLEGGASAVVCGGVDAAIGRLVLATRGLTQSLHLRDEVDVLAANFC